MNMPKVRISYSPDLSKIGSVEDVDANTAQDLIRTGRAVLVEDVEDLEKLKNAELAAKARALGAEVPSRASKADLVEVVRDAEAGKG